MSELRKHFYNFIREAEKVEDTVLQNLIKKIDTKHIRSILDVLIKRNTPQDSDDEINSNDDLWKNTKEFLLLLGPLSMKCYEQASITLPFEKSSEELKERLTLMVKCNLNRLKLHEIHEIQIRLIIAEQLARLCEFYNEKSKTSMNEFYNYLNSNFNVSRSTYCYYQQYYQFLDDFPRFKTTPINFTEMRRNIGRIRKWFKSKECSKVGINSYCSEAFWAEIATNRANPLGTNSMVIDMSSIDGLVSPISNVSTGDVSMSPLELESGTVLEAIE